jgi:hypothetical protein
MGKSSDLIDFMNKAAESSSRPNADRAHHLRRGRRLEYFTLGWNMLEAVVAIIKGIPQRAS